jgi:hypothetical protein
MATLQAALKRGIEHSYQIEESELATEPLPLEKDRKALMFYEAAEGGAGVLTHLAHDAAALAEVARAALRAMHYRLPDSGLLEVAALVDSEAERTDRDRCVAGCYRCLLSYFNQPEHEFLDRRDPDALEMLVALANGSTRLTKTLVANTETGSLSATLASLDAIPADEYDKPILQGRLTALAWYQERRLVVLAELPPAELSAELQAKGLAVVAIGADPARWADAVQANRHYFFKQEAR